MVLDWNKYVETARQVSAEGCVLLKNEAHTLPLQEGCRVAVFGRIQNNYYKSGTGSGGMVNVSNVTGILDALREEPGLSVDETVRETYEKWEKENPFDEGIGWANEPWSQVEMPLEEEFVRDASLRNNMALVIIGRTAGEDRDNVDAEGAYQLSKREIDMIEKVTSYFEKTAVLFNIGSIIDLSHPCLQACQAQMIVWQGGMVGGYGVADVLTGRVSPCGHLTDTIAKKIEDYPSSPYFGGEDKNFYVEDIYVGYRYFETVAKEEVLYPFGYGLSYTTFRDTCIDFSIREDFGCEIQVQVKNTGKTAGKHVVQAYVEAPQGKLGKSARSLCGFAKTGVIEPGEKEMVKISIPFSVLASYDDSGVTGAPYCMVLEPGTYRIYVGSDVRNAEEGANFEIIQQKVIEKLEQALAPVEAFDRFKIEKNGNGKFELTREAVPTGKKQEAKKREENLPEEIAYTGDNGYVLKDVADGKITMEEFVAQFSDEDLSCIVRGEGMGSPKVTPGTAAAYGGVSEHLKKMGIPCGCCSDGPSGMRIDCGKKAFSLPNGTLIACTWNTALVEQLFECLGLEMISNKIDNILGPGINIHRHPLNGRNFEYFSEDPLVSGKMAAAELRGLKKQGVTGTLKHFAANNQEKKRHDVDSIVSERALREIYLKGFEIAVKEAQADSVMTTYGRLNGVWTAGRYELNTTILRNQWGFTGIVMTDWWAKINNQSGTKGVGNDFASMVRAQNDIYMVCPQGDENRTDDNTLKELAAGTLTRGELQRSATNICRQLMSLPAFARLNGETETVEILHKPEDKSDFDIENIAYYTFDEKGEIPMDGIDTSKGSSFVFAIDVPTGHLYDLHIEYSSESGELAQIPMTIFSQGVPVGVVTFNGTDGETRNIDKKVYMATQYIVVRLYFVQGGVKIHKFTFTDTGKNIQQDTMELDGNPEFDFALR